MKFGWPVCRILSLIRGPRHVVVAVSGTSGLRFQIDAPTSHRLHQGEVFRRRRWWGTLQPFPCSSEGQQPWPVLRLIKAAGGST